MTLSQLIGEQQQSLVSDLIQQLWSTPPQQIRLYLSKDGAVIGLTDGRDSYLIKDQSAYYLSPEEAEANLPGMPMLPCCQPPVAGHPATE
jgi:hypothetical protein